MRRHCLIELLLSLAVVLVGSCQARSSATEPDNPLRPTFGYIDAQRVDCDRGEVFGDGHCQKDHGQAVIPNMKLELQKIYARMPTPGCETIFAAPLCGLPNQFITKPALEFMPQLQRR